MHNQTYPAQSGQLTANGPSRPPAPAQTPTEFTHNILNQTRELNDGLSKLRYRIFGDQPPDNSKDRVEPAEMSLEGTIQTVHEQLYNACEQLRAIHDRL